MASRPALGLLQSPPVIRHPLPVRWTVDCSLLPSFRIGRAEDAQFRIQNEYVSRYHAEVSFEGNQWHVRDLGSSNGIFVDGNPCAGCGD